MNYLFFYEFFMNFYVFYGFLWFFYEFLWFFMNFMIFYDFLTYFCLLCVYFYERGPRSMEIVSPFVNVMCSFFRWTVGDSTARGYSSFSGVALHGRHFSEQVRELCPNSPQFPHCFCFFSGSFSRQVRLLCPYSPQREHWGPQASFFGDFAMQVRELWPLPPQWEQVFSLDFAFT